MRGSDTTLRPTFSHMPHPSRAGIHAVPAIGVFLQGARGDPVWKRLVRLIFALFCHFFDDFRHFFRKPHNLTRVIRAEMSYGSRVRRLKGRNHSALNKGVFGYGDHLSLPSYTVAHRREPCVPVAAAVRLGGRGPSAPGRVRPAGPGPGRRAAERSRGHGGGLPVRCLRDRRYPRATGATRAASPWSAGRWPRKAVS